MLLEGICLKGQDGQNHFPIIKYLRNEPVEVTIEKIESPCDGRDPGRID